MYIYIFSALFQLTKKKIQLKITTLSLTYYMAGLLHNRINFEALQKNTHSLQETI